MNRSCKHCQWYKVGEPPLWGVCHYERELMRKEEDSFCSHYSYKMTPEEIEHEAEVNRMMITFMFPSNGLDNFWKGLWEDRKLLFSIIVAAMLICSIPYIIHLLK